MNTKAQAEKAAVFRRMHDRTRLLVLPNAWDALSARLFERAGFGAIATTSSGVAWSLGYADHALPRDEMIAATGRIARAVRLPVTADIEHGYGATPAELGATVRAVIAAGAVGVNLEDGLDTAPGLRPLDDAVARLRAARAAAEAAGVPIVINARVDVYVRGYGEDAAQRYDETLRRARAYLAAGADCIYPIGLGDAEAIGSLVRTLDAPVNIMARPGVPDAAALARLGVARASTAGLLAALSFSAAEQAARAVLRDGNFNALKAPLTYPDIERIFQEPF